MKLTPAQLEICTSRNFQGATIQGKTLTITDAVLFLADLTAAVADVSARPYHPATARELFATKYLLTKFEGLSKDETAPAVEIAAGVTVYLIKDPEQVFKVKKQNADGSWQVYGGLGQHQQFRDLHADRLTTRRKK
jgi:hypothetical protein